MNLVAETTRLLIRLFSPDDVSALTELLSDPEVMKHSVRGVCDEGATRRFVEQCLADYASHGIGPWALIEKGTCALVGFCGVGPERVGEAEELNLGYRLARRYWGRGLATEAARAVLAYAFGIKKCDSVIAIVEPEHTASLRVVEKVGFGRYQVIAYFERPVRLYRLTRNEWRAHGPESPQAL